LGFTGTPFCQKDVTQWGQSDTSHEGYVSHAGGPLTNAGTQETVPKDASTQTGNHANHRGFPFPKKRKGDHLVKRGRDKVFGPVRRTTVIGVKNPTKKKNQREKKKGRQQSVGGEPPIKVRNRTNFLPKNQGQFGGGVGSIGEMTNQRCRGVNHGVGIKQVTPHNLTHQHWMVSRGGP